MNPQLKSKAQQIIQQHPNLIKSLFSNIKEHLPFGIGESKVKGALADNIPEWVYDLNEHDLEEFLKTLQSDPDFYRWLRFNIYTLKKIINEE